MRNMQRTFSRYITHNRDHNELLFFILSQVTTHTRHAISCIADIASMQLVREALSYEQARLGLDMPPSVTIEMEDFEQRVCHIFNAHSVSAAHRHVFRHNKCSCAI